MKTRGLLLVSAITGVLCFSIQGAFAKTAGCPCSPCKCSPCTCGGKSSGSGGGGKHADHHGDHHSHHGGGLGVGGTIDLNELGSGLGRLLQRPTESRSTPVAKNPSPVAHTKEKRISKHKEKTPATNSFDDITLTGPNAKDENNPPNTFNVDNQEPPKTVSPDQLGDLKKAYDAYFNGVSEWLKKQPNWNSLLHDWTQSPNTDAGNKKSAKAKKKIDKLYAEFNSGDGKQLVDDWKTAFDNAVKSGASVDDNSLIPPPKDDIEKKKYAVIRAKNDLKSAQKNYDDKKQNEATKDEEVNKAREALNNFKSTNDPGYKGAIDDLNKAIEKAGQKWAATDEGKAEANKVHDAEKELGKAKEAWKPFEKYVEK
jgi:hypothetical protein